MGTQTIEKTIAIEDTISFAGFIRNIIDTNSKENAITLIRHLFCLYSKMLPALLSSIEKTDYSLIMALGSLGVIPGR